MDKHNNRHRKDKLLLQTLLDKDQQHTLFLIKSIRRPESTSDLIRQLLDEELQRLNPS